MDPAYMAASAGQNATNAAFQYVVNKENREWAEMMAQRQRDWALEDWQRNNQYNSPSQQMQRLKEAGINPALAYGKGAIDNSSQMVRSSGTPDYKAEAPQIKGLSESYLQGKQLKIQEDLAVAEIAKATADVLLKEAQADKTSTQTQFQKENWNTLKNTLDLKMKNEQLKGDNIVADTGKKLRDVDYRLKQIEWFDTETKAKLEQMEANTRMSDEQRQLIAKKIITEQEQATKLKLQNEKLTPEQNRILRAQAEYWEELSRIYLSKSVVDVVLKSASVAGGIMK